MRTITVGNIQLTFLQAEPDYNQLTTAQSATYRLLHAISYLKESISIEMLLQLLELDSQLPLNSRLRNLQRKGWVSIEAKKLITVA